MARFMTVESRGIKYLLDIDEIQAFQGGGSNEIRIIMKHEFYGLWANKNDVIRIMISLNIPKDEIARLIY